MALKELSLKFSDSSYMVQPEGNIDRRGCFRVGNF
jgi:hypothetical protein